MTAFPFPLEAWLARVGLDRAPRAGETGLVAAHEAQAFAIPFENLDIHLGRAIALEPVALAQKLVQRRRGGYCYELNTLFSLALEALGFRPREGLARVLWNRPGPGPRSHQLLRVRVGHREWLADVGFGGPGLRRPIPLEPGRIDRQHGEAFRLCRHERLGLLLQKEAADGWQDLYAFADEVTLPVDIAVANFVSSNLPTAPFVRSRMCALPAPWGRVTLQDLELKIHRDGITRRETLAPGPAYLAALAVHFGIELDAACEALRPLAAP
jgi:N-hydroxyarylamine O-acetyltransferase